MTEPAREGNGHPDPETALGTGLVCGAPHSTRSHSGGVAKPPIGPEGAGTILLLNLLPWAPRFFCPAGRGPGVMTGLLPPQ
jgi:hypothetical protein